MHNNLTDNRQTVQDKILYRKIENKFGYSEKKL